MMSKKLKSYFAYNSSEQGGALVIAMVAIGVITAAIYYNSMSSQNSIKESKSYKNDVLRRINNDFAIQYVKAAFELGPDLKPAIFPDPYFLYSRSGGRYPIANVSLVGNDDLKRRSRKSYYIAGKRAFKVKTPNLNSQKITEIYDENRLYGTNFELGFDSNTHVGIAKIHRDNPDHPLHINLVDLVTITSFSTQAQRKAKTATKGTLTRATIHIPAPVPTPILEVTSAFNADNEIDGDSISVDLRADGVVDYGRVFLVSDTNGPVGDPVDVATAKDPATGFPLHDNDSIFDENEFLGSVTFNDVASGTYTLHGQAIGVDGLVTETKQTIVVDNTPVFVEQTYTEPAVVRPVDYLFILDNSGSMAKIIDGVRRGFRTIQDTSIYPQNARLAVMNMMPGDPSNNFNSVHPDERNYGGRGLEPGFMRLIDNNSIRVFRNNGTTRYGLNFNLDGCGQWFTPGELNANGEPCIEAHTQISGGTSYETGKVTFSQMMQKTNNLFRNNALVNVIFISDTHDPGRDSKKILRISKSLDYATLLAQTQATNSIAQLKFHAIAPGQPCNGEGSWDLSYFELVEDSGGYKTEFCNKENYRSFLESMLERGASEDMTITLNNAAPIHKVFVDGKERTSYVRNGMDLTIHNIRRKGDTFFRIIYQI